MTVVNYIEATTEWQRWIVAGSESEDVTSAHK